MKLGLNFGAVFFLAYASLNAAPKKDLARLAILTFEDQTGTKNYGYLPGSLTEAVDKSLQGKFDYVREDPAKAEAARKIYHAPVILNAEQAADFSQRNGYDIVIYGSFTLDPTTREVIVTTYVSLGTKEKFRKLRERKNPADATIFSLADKVADDIVAEMTEVAKAQNTEGNPTAEAGKLELKKDTVTSWDNKKWNFSFEAGLAAPIGGNNVAPGAGVVLRLNRDILGRLYFGLELGGAFVRFGDNASDSSSNCGGSNCSNNSGTSNSSGDFQAAYGTGVLGYAFYPGNRWRIFADLGAGTARGGFHEEAQAGKTDQTRFLLRVASGVDFLLFSSVSFGLGFRVTQFPGSGQSFGYFQPGFKVTYTF